MKNIFAFFGSILIFLIHLPFVFAIVKPNSIPVSECSSVSVSRPFTYSAPNSSEKSSIYDSLKLNTIGLSRNAFDNALKGFNHLVSMGKLENDNILSIVDFSLPSGKKRLFVLDIKNFKVLFNTYVAHGRNSGKEFAKEFSNRPESNKSSLGFYITKGTYNGTHGFSLHLEGEEAGINDNAYSRAIVMHSADYVNEKVASRQGYIGRSLGCPALPQKVYKPIIEKIKNGSCLFLYSPDQDYLSHSRLLQAS